MSLKKILIYVLPVVFALVIVYYVFRGIDLTQVWNTLKNISLKWVLLSTLFSFLAHTLRGLRWAQLLRPLGYNCTGIRATVAVLVGYLANYALPRLGEVTRCGVLKNKENVPFETGFGTVVAERFMDLAIMILLLLINISVEYNKLFPFFRDLLLPKNATFGTSQAIFLLIFLLFLGGAGYYLFVRLKKKGIFKHKFLISLQESIQKFGVAIFSLKKVKNIPLFMLYTVLIWLGYYLANYILFFALPSTSALGLKAGLTVLCIGALAMSAPTNGGIGVYHLLVSKGLILYQLSENEGLIIATFIHGTQMIGLILMGLVALLLTFVLKSRNSRIHD